MEKFIFCAVLLISGCNVVKVIMFLIIFAKLQNLLNLVPYIEVIISTFVRGWPIILNQTFVIGKGQCWEKYELRDGKFLWGLLYQDFESKIYLVVPVS